MGSEQSHQLNGAVINPRHADGSKSRMQRTHTIATDCAEAINEVSMESSFRTSSRPNSPPASICSDSDAPYISYTNKPIGDSPKMKNNKVNTGRLSTRNISSVTKRSSVDVKSGTSSKSHNIVIVKTDNRKSQADADNDLIKLQSIPHFLPVIRETISSPASRDADIVGCLQPTYLNTICNRMQEHYSKSAIEVNKEQTVVIDKMKEVDDKIRRLYGNATERQKSFAYYAEQFSKTKLLAEQLKQSHLQIEQCEQRITKVNEMLGMLEADCGV